MQSTLRLFILVAAGWALAAAAQGAPPGLTMEDMSSGPACSQSCVVKELLTSGCHLSDIDSLADCLCSDIDRQLRLSVCVQESCSHPDAVVASKQSAHLCALYPVESRANEIRIMSIVGLAVGVPVTLARCLSRLIKTKSLGGDDWANVIATVFLIGLAVNGWFLADMGAGLHFWNVNPDNETTLWVLFWVSQHFYTVGQYFAKLSILMLYLRIFGCTRWMKRTCYGLMVALTTISTTNFLLIFFQCVPLATIWDKYRTDGHCIDVAPVAFAGGAMSIVWDVLLILLPIPEIRKLQISPRKRLGAAVMLALASCAAVTSVVRLRFIVQFNTTHDPGWDNVPVGVWSTIEHLCVIVCSSLPALRQWLIALIPNVTFSWGTTKGHSDSHTRSYAAAGTPYYFTPAGSQRPSYYTGDGGRRPSYYPPPTADSSRRPSGPTLAAAVHKRRSTLSVLLGPLSPINPFFTSPRSPGSPRGSTWQELPEVAPRGAGAGAGAARDLEKGVDVRHDAREQDKDNEDEAHDDGDCGPPDDDSKSLALATTYSRYSWASAGSERDLTRVRTQFDYSRDPGGQRPP